MDDTCKSDGVWGKFPEKLLVLPRLLTSRLFSWKQILAPGCCWPSDGDVTNCRLTGWKCTSPRCPTLCLFRDEHRDGGFLDRSAEVPDRPFAPTFPGKGIGYVDDDSSDLPSLASDTAKPNGHLDESTSSLITIKMKPDEQHRFGFNVKGGADQHLPILVSRVAPNTPADRCYPRLNEGDQILYINGIDVTAWSHEDVVDLIRRSAQEDPTSELVLCARQNVYDAEKIDDSEKVEEPVFQYVPDTTYVPAISQDKLGQSMLLIEEGLESGALTARFEQLYRKKHILQIVEAKHPENLNKNRYRDIMPYDSTRVVLQDSLTGDYINANYVKMEIPASGVVNNYIATQGPLPHTCPDFWQMIWEAHSTLIVMITMVIERGRVKCHKYWPQLYETIDYGRLQVTCVKEEESSNFAFREFTLINTESTEERHISHIQYLSWPDHGVPDDASDFLDFVQKVRGAREGMVDPVIVHCSAGIGRTGVLILMETAMCLIEANEPVYPLDIVKTMRDQRAMMIQTASQYRFVCESVLKVFNEGLVRPLPEFVR